MFKQDSFLLVISILFCLKRFGEYYTKRDNAYLAGGLLTGAISYARAFHPQVTNNRLNTGEICHIEMDFSY